MQFQRLGVRGGPEPSRFPDSKLLEFPEGRAVWAVSGQAFEGGTRDIFLIKARGAELQGNEGFAGWCRSMSSPVRGSSERTCDDAWGANREPLDPLSGSKVTAEIEKCFHPKRKKP